MIVDPFPTVTPQPTEPPEILLAEPWADERERTVFHFGQLLHKAEWERAYNFWADFTHATTGSPLERFSPAERDVKALGLQIFHWCLRKKLYALAASLLWPRDLFDPRPYCTRLIWDSIPRTAKMMVVGAASMSKSYSVGVWLLLDWLRDPHNTHVSVLGPSKMHLQDNLFTHLVNMHQNSILPLPGVTRELFIGLDTKNRFSAITGVIVPVGKAKAGRIQGKKKGRRTVPHPEFGTERRLRFFLDESEKIPPGIWADVDNVMANVDGNENFKIICAYNIEDPAGPSGSRSAPAGGWQMVDIDKDERWMSERGWLTVRLDGLRSENVIHGEVLFPGIQHEAGMSAIRENAGGDDTPGMLTMGRAYPPKVTASDVAIQPSTLASVRAMPIFVGETKRFMGGDPAASANGVSPYVIGVGGIARGYMLHVAKGVPPKEIIFRDERGFEVHRPALVITSVAYVKSGAAPVTAENYLKAIQEQRVLYGCAAFDATGSTSGVVDIMQASRKEIVRVCSSSRPSGVRALKESRLNEEDIRYANMATELWDATGKLMEAKCVFLSPLVEHPEMERQLTDRGMRRSGLKLAVEEKKAYRSRTRQKSPDEADSLNLCVHAWRMTLPEPPSYFTSVGSAGVRRGFFSRGRRATDVTNRIDSLDT